VLLSHLPPRMPELSIRECARWILRGEAGVFRNFQENYATNFFARYLLADTCGLDYGAAEYRRKRLGAAHQVLGGFLMVGICERMDESWSLLRRRAASAGIPLPQAAIPKQNVTAAERDSLDWIHGDDEVGRNLLRSVQEDSELYQAHLEQLKWLVSDQKVA